MIVVCPTCSSRFQYDESRFQDAPSKRFRCPKCSHVFEVQNPLQNPPLEELHTPAEEPAPRREATVAFQVPAEDINITAARPQEEVRAMIAPAPVPQGFRFTLAFLSGPHASTVKSLEQTVTVIGREEGDIITQDPETSRRHARLEIHWDGSVWLTDLNSTNGTFVDGVQIKGTVRLSDRQEFTCGKSAFMLLVRREDPGME